VKVFSERNRETGIGHVAKDYLLSGWTVTIERGVERGSPLEKWIVVRAINDATIRAKATARMTVILAR
jgi:hypothetical protein